MSALTTFRDHARRMSESKHVPECPSLRERRWGETAEQVAARACDGCVSDADRALFAQLAGEIDDYLAPQVDLFGEETVEPEPVEAE